jgi:hypothetical protein
MISFIFIYFIKKPYTLFIRNYLEIRHSDIKKQFEFINYLKMRITNVDKLDENDILNSGIIQTLAECIYFIWDSKVRFFSATSLICINRINLVFSLNYSIYKIKIFQQS